MTEIDRYLEIPVVPFDEFCGKLQIVSNDNVIAYLRVLFHNIRELYTIKIIVLL